MITRARTNTTLRWEPICGTWRSGTPITYVVVDYKDNLE